MLNLAEFALLIKLLDVKKLTTVNHRFSHHVFQTGLFDLFNNLLTFFDGRRHGNRAHHMLPGVQRLQRHPCMIRNGTVDVYKIYFRITQDIIVVGESFLDPELFARLIQFDFVSAADCRDIRRGMRLVNRYKFGSKTQSDHRSVNHSAHHPPFQFTNSFDEDSPALIQAPESPQS